MNDEQMRKAENKRSVTTALVLVIGSSLLIIGFVLMMRAVLAPKAQYNGKSATGQFEADQEGEFYQTQQNVSQPDTPADPQTEEPQ